jgi:transcriptional regulator with XRE-family HTH domain
MDILWQLAQGDLRSVVFLTEYLSGTPQQRRVPRIAERETIVVVPRKDNEPHPIDVYVGGRMRLRRIQLGLSQGALASKIGVSFQAVQKYESGDIRISASRLYDVSQVLDVSPAFVFEGYPDGMVAKNLAEDVAPGNETFDRREIMSLIRGYYGIRDPHLQADILRLISKLGNRASEPTT